MSRRVTVAEDAGAATRAAGAEIARALKAQVSATGGATLAISGGKSPRAMFEEMAGSGLDWSGVHLFWVDERAVPPDHPESNYRMAREALIEPAAIPAGNVHRIQTELDPEVACQRYVEEIRDFFELSPGEIPRFDVIHQGMGPDGHTASLFPGTSLVHDRKGIAAAEYVEKMSMWRVTLLPAVLLAAAETVMLVTGADKAEALRQVFNADSDVGEYPAALMARSSGNVQWFADAGAARLAAAGI